MWHDMWVIQIPVAEKIIRTVVVYAVLLLIFRAIGKRGLAQLSTFDFVVMFLLSNVVQNAVIGNDQSLLGGVVGAVTLIVVNTLVNRLATDRAAVGRLLEGSPTTVITDGRVDSAVVHRLGLRAAQLDHAVRMQNGDDVSEVASGSLQPGGQLVLSLKPEEQSATKGDVAALEHRLGNIEAWLAELAARPPRADGASSG